MGRLEKTIENKKNKKNKKFKVIFIIAIFLLGVSSINLIDYRTGNFMGIYDKSMLNKVCIYMKGLSFKIR